MLPLRRIATLAPAGALLFWLTTVAAGMAVLAAYAGTPGTPASPPLQWPPGSTIKRRAALPTVLVFAHPGCPCTRATLGEIDWILARAENRADVHVLLLRLEGADRPWPDTGLVDLARSIPNVEAQWDEGGEEARLFGVATSGQVLLYDNAGRLRFAGGITGARGHAGANAGRDELLLRLTAAAGDASSSPVFGCGLWSPPTT